MDTAPILTRTQLRELEAELRRERARLERATASHHEPDSAFPTPSAALRSPTNAEGALAVALETRALARHEALADALGRLEAGTFGYCRSCQRPSPYGRLAVVPETTRCVSC